MSTYLQSWISWCPSHSGLTRNEEADDRAKLGARLTPPDPNHKTQSYVAGLHKREMQEAWRHRWMNTPNHPCSGFTLANNLPLSLHTTERFQTLDHQTFSCLIQCRTGHAHISDYYWWFIPSETQNCTSSATIQTKFHVLKECRRNSKHRHLLGQGRHSQVGRLMGTIKGIQKLAVKGCHLEI